MSSVLVITDDVNGPAGEHEIEQFWHSGVRVSGLPQSAVPVFRLGSSARIALSGSFEASVEHGGANGWMSTVLGSRQETDVIILRGRASLPVSLETVVILGQEDPGNSTYIPEWARASLLL
jgi:hypothetical protein